MLLHRVCDVGRLRAACLALKRGAYRAKPVRRAYIPKADGRRRPLGVPALEAMIVQRAVVEVLNAIYEADFLGFSYGFRPRRSPHQALDAPTVGVMTRKVNWVLDADIRALFDTLDHGLLKFIEHRAADRRVVRLFRKSLSAGVLEDGKRTRSEVGTVQGGSISPLLANLYLHYGFDLWAQRWRRKQARGDVVVVRFADGFVVGLEHRAEAERFLVELRARFARFGPELHPDKTRLIEFGRFADRNRRERGGGKPETFHFLGFTHSCAKTRAGTFTVLRQTMRTRLLAKLAEVKAELRRRLHVLRRAHERAGAERLSVRRRVDLVAREAAAQSDPPHHRAPAPQPGGPLPADPAQLPSLSARALRPRHRRWEPDAVIPHVRICAGGAG